MVVAGIFIPVSHANNTTDGIISKAEQSYKHPPALSASGDGGGRLGCQGGGTASTIARKATTWIVLYHMSRKKRIVMTYKKDCLHLTCSSRPGLRNYLREPPFEAEKRSGTGQASWYECRSDSNILVCEKFSLDLIKYLLLIYELFFLSPK